uniref:Fasciclin-like arabinogalactan protein 4 n=1 Tax=Cuscuta campestris TaxID=132261 RepID=A0A2Z5U3S6_9ASTE|nr:fasciclin-like arabinogalactan protein 4 [Cuscuta campestris]
MERFPATAAIAAFLCIALSCFLSVSTGTHDITHILGGHPEFSTFNSYLTQTRLAAEINRRQTITVCVVNNAGMSDLGSKHLTTGAVKNVLSLHVLLDYFGAEKLHRITNGTVMITSLLQATGSANGMSGFVNITDLKGGKVGFWPMDNSRSPPATFVKSVIEHPYNISVIQISRVLTSPEAEAPAPGPAELNLTSLLESKGCGLFAHSLSASPDAAKTFADSVDGGLTIFCPSDDAMKKFGPKFKKLTGEEKELLLEYHGVPVHYSISDLKSHNGEMNTLATGDGKKYSFTVQNDGDDVKVETGVVNATIKDEMPKDSLGILTIDKVLEPKELFKAVASPSPAPAPAPEADAAPPKSGKKKKKSPAPAAADAPSPADSPSDSPADAPNDDDETADDNGAAEFNGGRFVASLIISLCVAFFI